MFSLHLKEELNWMHCYCIEIFEYRNDPKFSDRYAWANSADPDQTAPVCIIWTHYSMVGPHSSNFRVITTNVLGVRIFRKFTVNWMHCYCIEIFE